MACLVTALVTLLAVPLLATPASAAATASVVISQIPTRSLVVSIDAGGTVTFVNSIPASQQAVSLLGLASVTVETDVSLTLPSGKHSLAFGASHAERFDAPFAGSVTYAYRVTSRLPLGRSVSDVLGGLAIPVPTPMIVNTILPLPNLPLPPVNVPAVPAIPLPPVNVPAVPEIPLPAAPAIPLPAAPAPPAAPIVPALPGVPTVPAAPGLPNTPGTPPTVVVPPTSGGTNDTGTTAGEETIPGSNAPLVLGPPNGLEQRRPTTSPATSPANSPASAAATTEASRAGLGQNDGAPAPIFGVLDGLDRAESGPTSGVLSSGAAAAGGDTLPSILGTPALLAVLLLSVVSVGLVRTTILTRRSKLRTATA